MRIVCLLLVGTFVLSKVHAENSNTPIRKFHGYKKSIVESDARNMTGGLKSSARQIESYHKGRDVRARRYSRVTIGPMGYRKTIKTLLPVQAGKMKKVMGLTRLNPSQRRRSLDVSYSTQNSLKQTQYSQNHKEVSNVIHLEPIVHTVERSNVFDWMLKLLRRIIGSDKINDGKTPVKNFGLLIGPVNFPGIGSNVYIRQLDPVHEEADHVVIHLVQKVLNGPHESPMSSADSLSRDSLAKPSTIQSALLPPNASASSYKISLPANHRSGEKNTSDVNTLGIRYSNPSLLQNIRRYNFMSQNMYPGLPGEKNSIPVSQRPDESHEYHSAISIIQSPPLRQTPNNIREEKKGSSYNKDIGNVMTVPLESSKKIQNSSIYPPLLVKSRDAEDKDQDILYPMEDILSEESQIIGSNRVVPSSASLNQPRTQMNVGDGLKVITAPNLSGGSQSNLKNSANYIQKTNTMAPINYSSHHYVNKESMNVDKSAVSNDNKIISSTSSIMENVTHKSAPSVMIVTPNYPWHYDKTTERLKEDIKPVYEIPNDYEDDTTLRKFR